MESPSRLALKDVEMVSKGEKETVTSSRSRTSRYVLHEHNIFKDCTCNAQGLECENSVKLLKADMFDYP